MQWETFEAFYKPLKCIRCAEIAFRHNNQLALFGLIKFSGLQNVLVTALIVLFLYSLKTPESFWFSDAFRGYRKELLA